MGFHCTRPASASVVRAQDCRHTFPPVQRAGTRPWPAARIPPAVGESSPFREPSASSFIRNSTLRPGAVMPTTTGGRHTLSPLALPACGRIFVTSSRIRQDGRLRSFIGISGLPGGGPSDDGVLVYPGSSGSMTLHRPTCVLAGGCGASGKKPKGPCSLSGVTCEGSRTGER